MNVKFWKKKSGFVQDKTEENYYNFDFINAWTDSSLFSNKRRATYSR